MNATFENRDNEPGARNDLQCVHNFVHVCAEGNRAMRHAYI